MGFDPYWEWLKIPRDQRPPNHYELLGVLRFEADEKRVRAAYRQRYALVRKYAIGARQEDATRLIEELSEAHDCLSRSESREEYERGLRETSAARDTALSGCGALPAFSDTPSETDTLAEDRSTWPPEKKATLTERVPPTRPPPPPPEFSAADSNPSALPPPPPLHEPSWVDSWRRLSAPERWFAASVGVSGVAVVLVAVVVGVVAATGTGVDGEANEVAEADSAAPGGVGPPSNNTAPSPDDTAAVADADRSTATDDRSAGTVTVPTELRRGSSILDVTQSDEPAATAPGEAPDVGTAAAVPLPNGDPAAAELSAGATSALGNPSLHELTDAVKEAPVTLEPEPPIGSDTVVARRTPGEEAGTGGDSPATSESVKLVTEDGAQIHCTWYPSPKAAEQGKEVVPVIVVHGWGEERSLYDGLARSLQSTGHAVMVPDLRGHGGSTVILTPVESRELRVEVEGDTMKVNGKKMLPSDALNAMVRYDLEAVKDFLFDKNNAEKLNIQLLCLVASEEGSIVALNWVAADWSWLQPALIPQGGHVKAVALVSPAMVFKGVNLQQTLTNHFIRDQLPVTIIVGEQDTSSNREARRFYMALNRARPSVPSRDKIRKRDLALIDVNSNLQGAKLLAVDAFEVDEKIASFIDERLVRRARQYPWAAR